MPRVHHVKKAYKDHPEADIKKGESYYWWQFRYGGKHFSKTPPKASQLTQSEYLSQFYGLQEQFEAIGEPTTKEDIDSAADDVESIAEEIRQLGEEQAEKRDAMPDQLQDGEVGELLQNRADACDSLADELDGVVSELRTLYEDLGEEPEDPNAEVDGESWSDRESNACSEAYGHLNGISFESGD
jgi:hypothetical protein